MVLSLGWRAGGQVVLTLVFILGRQATVLARVVLILGLRAGVRGGVNLSGRELERVVVLSLGRRARGELARVMVLLLVLRAVVRGGVRLQSLTFGCCAVVIKQNSVRCFKSSSRGAPADTSYAVHAACFGAVWSDVRFGHI